MRITDVRRLERESQTRSWAAPLPDFSSMPRSTEAPRIRIEWDTRDTMNNRLWSDLQATGPTAITSAGLQAHPSSGSMTTNPTVSRQDTRSYLASPYFSGSLLPSNVSWTAGGDDQNAIRSLKNSVKETRLHDDAGARILERNFTHQWVPADMTKRIVDTQLETAERLRPQQDEWRTSFMK